MSNSENIHFRMAANSHYLGACDLPDYKERVLTVDRCVFEMTEGLAENSKMNVLYFKEAGVKPMLLNATNSRAVRSVTRSSYINEWAGHRVTLFVKENVKAFGILTDALRIKPTKPAAAKKPELVPTHPRWKDAQEAVKGGTTITQLRARFDITDINFKKLLK